MISIHHQAAARRTWLIAAAVLLVLVLGRVITQTVHAASNESRSGRHVLTVYDNGQELGLLTEAGTLREALEDAGIKLAANDIAEPALDEELVAASYEVNIYRARPVTIIDDDMQTKVMTPYRTAKQIADQADIELHDEDRVEMEYSGDVLLAGSLERMVIDRATEISFVFFGKKLTVRTHADTVADMLAERDIELGQNDSLSLKPESPIVPGMKVELWRDGKQTMTQQEKIDFTVQQIEDSDRSVGYRKVKTPGVEGEKTVTYEVEMRNGEEVSRRAIKTVVTKQPVKQVEVVGTKNNYSGSLNEWLLALRTCETHGNYQANTGNGFYGAYQFMIPTWDSIARLSGRTDLVGVRPDKASPADQDAMVIANTKATAGLSTQHPGCYAKLGLSNKPPQ